MPILHGARLSMRLTRWVPDDSHQPPLA